MDIHDAIYKVNHPKPDDPCFSNAAKNPAEFLDEALVSFLESHLSSHPPSDPTWKTLDKRENTILHLLVDKPEALTWILDRDLDVRLHEIRNHEGETPAETLQSALEEMRVKRGFMTVTIHVSDEFQGYGLRITNLLKRLQGRKNSSMSDLARLNFGCTCGDCTDYMSPRMRFALHVQAALLHDMLGDQSFLSPREWVEYYDFAFEHIRPAIVQNLKTNKSLRKGVINVFSHIARCLEKKEIPTDANVTQFVQASRERTPVTKKFLESGGKASSVVLVLFDRAMEEDLYLGSGEHESTFQEDIEKLPKCRNDHEFRMAKRIYEQGESVDGRSSNLPG